MDRRHATLSLIAILTLADLVGAVLLHDAWSDRQSKAVVSAPVGKASAVHAGM